MTTHSTEHATLVIERQLKAPISRVFRAWSTPEAKRQWFACHGEWVPLEYTLDFRPGGAERNHVADTDGLLHAYDAHYIDIVPDSRIIYAYEMKLGERRISASLTTVTFKAEPAGTRMTFTEQVVFLDGYADNGARLQGTEIGLDNLELFLEREASPIH
ncbi:MULTISPECIES: SRPBCC family protein [unclassified Rhizobium]|uniref:SRPBCC family protein n=1 Tax=unclassified Rhizobium TaxID=2613769 RepID=UPI0007EA490C|nr:MULTISPECIES: SRPBCC family protein [unclassified Rhizobium]ANM10918.1 activator of Hsp90 ATPase 1 family protein [Rhizobium sp. N324]ANM17460.1 activator of Hsp90 ATPase 1 family protein [Rhizobium sp. N541]ANM23845.1 activator of Hsp90 ATPase 1 family protein [Rhizobium sp. N941]OYD04519.1 activator of Hsp90 ATPase 1 family protein [Rhizobium sp. N4311]